MFPFAAIRPIALSKHIEHQHVNRRADARTTARPRVTKNLSFIPGEVQVTSDKRPFESIGSRGTKPLSRRRERYIVLRPRKKCPRYIPFLLSIRPICPCSFVFKRESRNLSAIATHVPTFTVSDDGLLIAYTTPLPTRRSVDKLCQNGEPPCFTEAE